MITVQQVFDMAIHLMDEQNEQNGHTQHADTDEYRYRTISILNSVIPALYPYSGNYKSGSTVRPRSPLLYTEDYENPDFEQGIPVALNDEKMSAKNIILKLNEIGGANGIGLLDIVENRLVGMKCRGVYETPGGSILYKAHSVLESICLDKMTLHEKQRLAITYAELVYNGQWFTPLREALAAFVDKTQESVTGKVRLKLYKGNMINAGVWSDYSLYSEEIATFGESDYDQTDAAGFINLFGLPIKVQAMVDGK